MRPSYFVLSQAPTYELDCRRPKRSEKKSRAQTSLENAPVIPRNMLYYCRPHATTAVMPLVRRSPWPAEIPKPARSKDRSVLPVSALPATKMVAIQARSLQSQTLKRSSSCGVVLQGSTDRSHKDAQETNVSTVSSFVDFVKTRTRAGYYINLVLMCKKDFYLRRAQDGFTPCIKEDGPGMGNASISEPIYSHPL